MTPDRAPTRRLAPLASLLLLLPLGACSSVTTVNTAEPAQMRSVPNEILLKHISPDPSLGDGARVESAYEGRTPTGALQVQVNIVNRRASTEQDFMWKCEWFDSAGMAIPGPDPQWTKVILLPGQRTTVSLVATTTAASSWRLSLTNWIRKP